MKDHLHVAIIMDGNGRWAQGRGLPRTAGHREGVRAVRRTVEAAPELGVGTLTLYAFSSDNWRRPRPEVSALMRLFRTLLAEEVERCRTNGVRLNVIGRRDRLPASLVAAIEAAEAATTDGENLLLRLAIDYSARDALLRAAALPGAATSRDRFAEALGTACHASEPAPDVDLLIRTGGEQRLSDFLLWECAYAELLFSPTAWPDFSAADLKQAVETFHHRDRRFGQLSSSGTALLPARKAA